MGEQGTFFHLMSTSRTLQTSGGADDVTQSDGAAGAGAQKVSRSAAGKERAAAAGRGGGSEGCEAELQSGLRRGMGSMLRGANGDVGRLSRSPDADGAQTKRNDTTRGGSQRHACGRRSPDRPRVRNTEDKQTNANHHIAGGGGVPQGATAAATAASDGEDACPKEEGGECAQFARVDGHTTSIVEGPLVSTQHGECWPTNSTVGDLHSKRINTNTDDDTKLATTACAQAGPTDQPPHN